MNRADQPAQVAAGQHVRRCRVDRSCGRGRRLHRFLRREPVHDPGSRRSQRRRRHASAAGEAGYQDVQGGSRSTLVGGNNEAPGHSGGSRQTIIHRPDDAEEGGLLAGTPVGATVDSVLSTVSQAVPVPLPVEATVSVPGCDRLPRRSAVGDGPAARRSVGGGAGAAGAEQCARRAAPARHRRAFRPDRRPLTQPGLSLPFGEKRCSPARVAPTGATPGRAGASIMSCTVPWRCLPQNDLDHGRVDDEPAEDEQPGEDGEHDADRAVEV